MHEWASLRSELIWIYDREVRPHYLRGQNSSGLGNRVWLIRRGTVTVKSGGRTLTVGPGKWIMPGKQFSEHIFSPKAHILSVHFLCQWPSGEDLIVSRDTLIVKSEKCPALERDAKKLDGLLRRQFPDEGRGEQIYNRQSSGYEDFLHFQSLFLNWLAVWFRFCLDNGAQLTRLTSGDSRPFQAARCLNQAPLDRPFPAEWLQRETGLSILRLNQLFFREFGMTTRKFWDRRRIDFAKQCLETSLMPMKEISHRLSFRSDSHFVTWFRRLTGSRPRDYRRTYLHGIAASQPAKQISSALI